jgi:hypothetical protein
VSVTDPAVGLEVRRPRTAPWCDMRKAVAATGAAQRKMIGRGTGNERRQAPVSLSRLASSFSPSYSLATFHAVLRDLGITANLVWGRARRDPDWAADFDAVLLATRREELEHGTNAAYVQGCVRPDCRAHQLRRMAKGKLNNCGC